MTGDTSYTYRWPRPALTVDIVVFGFAAGHAGSRPRLDVLLIERDQPPFEGRRALPGGFVGEHEDLEAAALRELEEETSVRDVYLEQLYTFGAPGRDPRGHTVSVAYVALVRPTDHPAVAASDARRAVWTPVEEATSLAFDHDLILKTALDRLRAKLRYRPIGFSLLPDEFTLGELQDLYETALGHPLDKRNFRKRVEQMGVLVPTGSRRRGPHRSAALYRFDRARYDALDVEAFDL